MRLNGPITGSDVVQPKLKLILTPIKSSQDKFVVLHSHVIFDLQKSSHSTGIHQQKLTSLFSPNPCSQGPPILQHDDLGDGA